MLNGRQEVRDEKGETKEVTIVSSDHLLPLPFLKSLTGIKGAQARIFREVDQKLRSAMLMSLRVAFLVTSSIATLLSAADAPLKTDFEFSVDQPEVRSKHGSFAVGTCTYAPSKTEKPYFDRLSEAAQLTFQSKREPKGQPSSFSLQKHGGQFVSWFGIVRGITRREHEPGGTLLVENKYFDGLTDCHIQTIDFAGGGDFRVGLSSVPEAIIPLVLVRVYGVVTEEKKQIPLIRAEFVRVWHWGQFNFMDFGQDRGNLKWKRGMHLPKGEDLYHMGASPKYYDERLGPTKEEWEEIKAFHVGQTEIEFSRDPYDDQTGASEYVPTEWEQPYFTRLARTDRVTVESKQEEVEHAKFQLRGHVDQFVSWFGIIREATPYISRPGGTLLIENKYFKGSGDRQLQTVSLRGGGNFKVELTNFSEDLAPLYLVRVYGNVIREDGDVPVVEVRYVRIWGWDQFNFDDYGVDYTNPRWTQNVQLKHGEAAYASKVSADYYINRLGPTEEQAQRIKVSFMSDEELQKFYEEREKANPSPK